MAVKFSKRRLAFTLLELLVTLAVILTIVSLTLPAVLSAREKNRVAGCLSNLRQQGLAMSMAEQILKIVPHNGGATRRDQADRALGSQIISREGSTVTVSITYNPAIKFPLGVGNPRVEPQQQPGPWCYAILPYLGEKTAFELQEFRRPQPIYVCPSRNRSKPTVPVDDELFECESGDWPWAKTDYAATYNIAYVTVGQPLSKFVPYGLENLILIGEKAMDPFLQTATSWYHDEPLFVGGTSSTARTGRAPLGIDGELSDIQNGFGSIHTTGVNFVFFSGRTQTISRSIDETTWSQIAPAIPFNGNPVLPSDED